MRVLFPILLFASSAAEAATTAKDLSPEDQKVYQNVVVSFVVADECSKRYDSPEVFRKATELFRRTALKFNLTNAEAEVARAASDLSSKPLDNPNGFTLATAAACRKLDAELSEQLSK